MLTLAVLAIEAIGSAHIFAIESISLMTKG